MPSVAASAIRAAGHDRPCITPARRCRWRKHTRCSQAYTLAAALATASCAGRARAAAAGAAVWRQQWPQTMSASSGLAAPSAAAAAAGAQAPVPPKLLTVRAPWVPARPPAAAASARRGRAGQASLQAQCLGVTVTAIPCTPPPRPCSWSSRTSAAACCWAASCEALARVRGRGRALRCRAAWPRHAALPAIPRTAQAPS